MSHIDHQRVEHRPPLLSIVYHSIAILVKRRGNRTGLCSHRSRSVRYSHGIRILVDLTIVSLGSECRVFVERLRAVGARHLGCTSKSLVPGLKEVSCV